MDDDDFVCLCFHVSKRKVIQYLRVVQPVVPSQLSECYGAGSGCGWCRPYLTKLMQQHDLAADDLPDRQSYAAGRKQYRQSRPPGQRQPWSTKSG